MLEWVTRDFIKVYLHNTRRRMKKKKNSSDDSDSDEVSMICI